MHLKIIFHNFTPKEQQDLRTEVASVASGQENADSTLDPLDDSIFVECNPEKFSEAVGCGDFTIDTARRLKDVFYRRTDGIKADIVADRVTHLANWSHIEQTEFNQVHIFKRPKQKKSFFSL